MTPPQTFDLVPSGLSEFKGAWNTDGYRMPSHLELVTRIIRLPLDNIYASDLERGRLTRLSSSPDGLVVEFLSYSSVHGFTELRPQTVHVDRHELTQISLPALGDVGFSTLSGTLYLVDIEKALIHRFNCWEVEASLSPIKLPHNLALSHESRIAVRSRQTFDSTLYLTVPDDHVVVRIKESVGETQVYCGKAGQESSGDVKEASPANRTRISRPGAIAYDTPTNRIAFFNKGDMRLYFIDDAGTLRRLIDDPLDFEPSSLLFYRLSDFRDSLQLRLENNLAIDAWGESPTLLLVGSPSTSSIYKAGMHRDVPSLARAKGLFLPGVDRLLPLQGGDLLITTEAASCTILKTFLHDPSQLHNFVLS